MCVPTGKHWTWIWEEMIYVKPSTKEIIKHHNSPTSLSQNKRKQLIYGLYCWYFRSRSCLWMRCAWSKPASSTYHCMNSLVHASWCSMGREWDHRSYTNVPSAYIHQEEFCGIQTPVGTYGRQHLNTASGVSSVSHASWGVWCSGDELFFLFPDVGDSQLVFPIT